MIAHTLKGEGHDASEDGTGRGVPLVPDVAWALQERDAKGSDSSTKDGHLIPFDTTQITHPANRSNPGPGDPCPPLPAHGHAPAVAFDAKRNASDSAVEELAPTLRAMSGAHANGGGQVAVAFQARIARNGRGQPSEIAPALGGANAGATSDMRPMALHLNAVRRLTPRECERLQGFPDDYTLIPFGRRVAPEKLDRDFLKYQLRGNPKHLTREDLDRLASDGPRYKALGNSMAVPVMRWIARQIDRTSRPR